MTRATVRDRKLNLLGGLGVFALILLPGCEGDSERLGLDQEDSPSQAGSKIEPALLEELQRNGSVEAIVEVDDSPALAQQAASDSARRMKESRFEHVAAQGALQKRRLRAEVGLAEADLLHDYHSLGSMHVRITSRAQLDALQAHAEIVRVVPNQQYQLFTASDLTLINQPAAQAAGDLGDGTTVAVIDTGIDFKRAPFNCAVGASDCAVAYRQDFADGNNSSDAQGQPTHATNVAGIVLSVAPKARVAALDVFVGQYGYLAAISAAINWCINNKVTYNIVAINMSLGGGRYTAACPNDYLANPVNRARQAGIISVIASGNDASSNAIASPACIPTAVSVGAVYDRNVGGVSAGVCVDSTTAADKVACFSNSASFLSILAPGVFITAPAGAQGITMSGTSQATPHVAGAVAVLRAAFANDSLDPTVARLTTTGRKVTDTRNKLSFPRLDLAAAIAYALPVVKGTIEINAGAATTAANAVSVTMTITQGQPVDMCLSNSATLCSTFIPYATPVTWNLSSGDGAQTVTVWWRNSAGVASTPASATILLDTTPPAGGTLTATSIVGRRVTWKWTGVTDAGSGVATYKLLVSTLGAPAKCSGGSVVYSGTSTTYTHTLTAAGTYTYLLCATDKAGNIGPVAGNAVPVTATVK